MPIEILENIIIDDSQNLNLTGSAIFGNTVDASGFTINGNPIGNSQTIISNFAPNTGNYSAGTMWWNSNSTDGSLYILYQDPSGPNGDPGGKYWVSATPGIVDLSLYDTSEQVDAKIAAIPSTDLSGYDTSTQVDSKISSSLTDYYTATQVDSKVANDLASYDTSTQVDNKISNSLLYYDTSSVIDTKIADLVASAPETLNTLGELAIALTGNDSAIDSILATLATKADSSSIPTNNNQLTNGANYITSASVGNGTITITQPGASNQTFTVNQSGNTTIALRNDNTDTNTTYSAASNGGLTLDGTQFKINVENLNTLPQ